MDRTLTLMFIFVLAAIGIHGCLDLAATRIGKEMRDNRSSAVPTVAPVSLADEAAAEANRPPWEEVGEFSPVPFGEAAPRGHEWAKVSSDFRKANPTCAACGCDQNLAVHHVKPWRLCTGPEEPKRLDPSNLVSLCCCKTHQCHWREGHLSLSWRASNPNVKEDSARFLKTRQAATIALRNEANPPAEGSEE